MTLDQWERTPGYWKWRIEILNDAKEHGWVPVGDCCENQPVNTSTTGRLDRVGSAKS